MRNIVFFDVDNVLVKGQTQKLLVRYLFEKQKIKLSLLLSVYLWFFLYKLHLARDVMSIRSRSFRVFRGWGLDESKEIFDDFFRRIIIPHIYQKSVKTIKMHIANGDEVILLSASLSEIVDRLKDFLGVKYAISTHLDVADAGYTGKISGMVPYGENKLVAIKHFLKENKIVYEDCFVYADHFSDKDILEFATHPVAINPDMKLKVLSMKRNWPAYDL